MIGNKCGDVGHIFIGHANSDLKLEQIAKYKFTKNGQEDPGGLQSIGSQRVGHN